MPLQAQKHITHNESIKRIDTLTQLSVLSKSINSTPVSPQVNDQYIIGTSPTDEWTGRANEITVYTDAGWEFITPKMGWLVWIIDEQNFSVYLNDIWEPINTPELHDTTFLGINANADTENRFLLNAPNSLFNHEGAGHRLKVNKNTHSDTASLLFQTGYTGHAELGLTGTNHFNLKVSPDGQNWHNTLNIDNQTGNLSVLSLKSGVVTINDDSVLDIVTKNVTGFITVMVTNETSPETDHCGMFCYATGTSLSLSSLAIGSKMLNQGDATLTGTTGQDGHSSLATKTGNIQIENRSGNTQNYTYTFIG